MDLHSGFPISTRYSFIPLVIESFRISSFSSLESPESSSKKNKFYEISDIIDLIEPPWKIKDSRKKALVIDSKRSLEEKAKFEEHFPSSRIQRQLEDPLFWPDTRARVRNLEKGDDTAIRCTLDGRIGLTSTKTGTRETNRHLSASIP